VLPWRVKAGDAVVDQPVVPALCINDEELEMQEVLAGRVIAQVTGVTAAHLIRSGKLVPLLTQHVADNSSVFVYYGSRAAQPARARAFIDLAVKRLTGNADYVLSAKELTAAERKGVKLRVER
jgi:DNA-binding transcriptional LysR family regulator